MGQHEYNQSRCINYTLIINQTMLINCEEFTKLEVIWHLRKITATHTTWKRITVIVTCKYQHPCIHCENHHHSPATSVDPDHPVNNIFYMMHITVKHPSISKLNFRNIMFLPHLQKLRIYKTIILPFVIYGCETWSLTLREEYRLWECLRTGCWGGYLDLRGRKWHEAGEDCIMTSFITCMLHQILLR
jgi:hypothetical protein